MSTERSPLLSSPQRDQDSVYSPVGIRHGRRPLLSEDSDDEAPADDVESLRSSTKQTLAPRQQVLKTIVTYAFLCLFILLLLSLAGIHLIAGRLLSRILEDPQGLQTLGEKSIVLSGPVSVSVDEVTNDAVKMRLSVWAGVDVQAGLANELEEASEGQSNGIVRRIQDDMLRWAVKRAGRAHIQADEVQLSPARGHHRLPFASVQLLDSLVLPLHFGSSEYDSSSDWLDHVDIPVQIQLHRPNEVVKLALDAWKAKQFDMMAQVPKTSISFDGMVPRLMGRLMTLSISNIGQNMRFQVPNLSFLQDPSQLVTLTDYAIHPKQHKSFSKLNYVASASIENPLVTRRQEFPKQYRTIIDSLGDPDISVPWSVSADAYLLGQKQHTVNFSRATLQPFGFHLLQRNVTLHIAGQVNPQASDDLNLALSSLMSNYLAGQETPFKVHPAAIDPKLPKFLADILNDMPLISLQLPGSPDPDAQLLQNVSIQHMHLDGTGPNSELLVSGSVVGDVVLPAGLEELASALQLKSLWPDVLVFDGSPSWTLDHKDFPPDPLPRGAFARLSPKDWTSVKTSSTPEGLHIDMKMEGVPMSVLPGRGDLFRSYTAKVLFGTGDGPNGQVRTGIWGFADAKATIPPLPSLTLEDILVQGEFFVSKGGVFSEASETPGSKLQHD